MKDLIIKWQISNNTWCLPALPLIPFQEVIPMYWYMYFNDKYVLIVLGEFYAWSCLLFN